MSDVSSPDWPRVHLGEVISTVKGRKPKSLTTLESPGYLPYIDISAVEQGTKRQWADPSDSRVVPAGTLVMVWDGARSGWVGRTRFDGALGSTLAAIGTTIDSAYLEVALRAQFHEINSNHRGSGIPHVDPGFLKNIEIAVPSPEVQRGVVSLSASIDDARISASAHLANASRAIDVLRQSILAAASSGGLTEDLREDDDPPVEQLLVTHSESSRASINKRRMKPAIGLAIPDQSHRFPSTWAYLRVRELVALRAILDVQDGNHGDMYPRKADFGESGVPFISAESVWDRIEIETAPRLRHEVAARLRLGFAQSRDVVLTHNATVGRVAILPDDVEPVVLSTSTTYYRVDESVLLPEYLLLFMRSVFFQDQLAAVMSQTTRNQVPVTKQVELVVAVPSPAEQRMIVERADRLLGLAHRLAKRINLASHRVNRGSRAALAKALRGELVGLESG